MSTFRSKMSYFFNKVKQTKRPLIITQNGKSSAILLDVAEYQSLIDKIEVFEDIKLAEEQISSGKGISHSKVKKMFDKKT